jgi:predicted RNase H-like HicB family nuclease
MAKSRYKQALIDTDDGTWGVSVPAEVEINEQGRIETPQDVFEDGSQLVAVEAGVSPAGEYTEIPNPFEVEEARDKAGGNGHEPSHVRLLRKAPGTVRSECATPTMAGLA